MSAMKSCKCWYRSLQRVLRAFAAQAERSLARGAGIVCVSARLDLVTALKEMKRECS